MVRRFTYILGVGETWLVESDPSVDRSDLPHPPQPG